jgi:3-oxoacyl-[acyl-carrier-protein] synthase III
MATSRTIITGTGSYIPTEKISNRDFTVHNFYAEDHTAIETDPVEVVQKFQEITGIVERRYATKDLNCSDIATIAAREAIKDSGIDPETIDQIIVAHNFGNVIKHTIQTDAVPALASRVKHNLGIRNPRCIGYDILFGCPGWVQGLIQADAFFKAGIAKTALVIGAETLSRVLDKYDRDSMIFADGAGAVIAQYQESEDASGVLSTAAVSHCVDEAYFIYLGKSNFPGSDSRVRYIKMHGRKVYEYAMKQVAQAMKECLDNAGIEIGAVNKIFLHQANEKMDEGIIKTLYKLYGTRVIPTGVMPMSIHWLGNSSVATVPTLLDLVRKGKMPDHKLTKGDIVLFASVGAGMNINAVAYRV